MIKLNRILAIVSSIILVLNYVEINIGTFFFNESSSLIKLEVGVFRIIFTVSLVIVYFYLARYFRSIGEKEIQNLIYIGLVFAVLPQIMRFFYSNGQSFVELISTLFYLGNFVLIIIWGIKILKLNKSIDKNIKLVKAFVICLFISLIINFIGTPILMFTLLMNNYSLILLPYIVPYSLLTLFFIKNR